VEGVQGSSACVTSGDEKYCNTFPMEYLKTSCLAAAAYIHEE